MQGNFPLPATSDEIVSNHMYLHSNSRELDLGMTVLANLEQRTQSAPEKRRSSSELGGDRKIRCLGGPIDPPIARYF